MMARSSAPANIQKLIDASGDKTKSRQKWAGDFVGITPRPTGTKASSYVHVLESLITTNVYTHPGVLGVINDIPLQRALVSEQVQPAEGDNVSLYLAAGIYEVDRYFDKESYEEAKQSGGVPSANSSFVRREGQSPTVRIIVTNAIAGRNKLAEEDHCRDFIFAYDQAVSAVAKKLTGAILASHIADLPPWTRTPGGCLGKFDELCDQSKKRDINGWHTFILKKVDEGEAREMIDKDSLRNDDLQENHSDKVAAWLQLIESSTMNIGVPSNQVIETISL